MREAVEEILRRLGSRYAVSDAYEWESGPDGVVTDKVCTSVVVILVGEYEEFYDLEKLLGELRKCATGREADAVIEGGLGGGLS